MLASQKRVQHIRGFDFQGNPVEELKTTPDQLSLFQNSIANGCSSTIELFDAMPCWFGSPKEMEALRQKNGGRFLDTLVREFRHRGKACKLTVKPARITSRDGVEREYYPSKSVLLIGKALRKLATDPLNGIYLGGQFGVQFMLGELRRELKQCNHGMSYQSVMDGLKIGNATHTVLDSTDGSETIRSSLFPVFIHASREQWEKYPKNARCYVKFHPLVTQSVEELTYRQSNYGLMMKLNRMLSFYLFDRMSHLYRQASLMEPYTISLNTLLSDSHMDVSMYPSDNLKNVRRTLAEFQDRGVIFGYDEQITRGLNNRIANVKFSLYPTPAFVSHTIEANLQQKRSKKLSAA